MKKKSLVCLVAVVVLLLCCGMFLRFGSPRIKIVGTSAVFSKTQIKDAMDIVEMQLSENSAVSSIIDIRFNEAKSGKRLDGWRSGQQIGVTQENSIVVFADFFTSKDSGAFNPNDLYTGFGFTLQMQKDGHWNMVEGGAGYP